MAFPEVNSHRASPVIPGTTVALHFSVVGRVCTHSSPSQRCMPICRANPNASAHASPVSSTPDALLKTLKASDAPSNEERKRLGMEALYTEGWQVPPHYDLDTKRLEWGMRLRTGSNHYVINYSSRLLGRSGVMSAVLVADPETLAADTAQFKAALKDFDYVPGEKYSEFKAGDRIAEYGLAALIVGGAAAVATKKGFWSLLAGFFAAFWKVLAGLGVAALAGLGSIFKRKQT